ncbi:hypothetical protein KAR91_33745 [Candidatus Pacearchaeota archaeon]|nr:hypothetical protein [Candidatus Pacearchaeota archaeon]
MKKLIYALIAIIMAPIVTFAGPPSAPQLGGSGDMLSPGTVTDGSLVAFDGTGGVQSKEATIIPLTSILGTGHIGNTGRTNGGIHVIEHTDPSYTVGTTDAYDPYGSLHINSDDDALTIGLLEGVASSSAQQSGCVENGKASTSAITLDPAAGDYLVKDGTACAQNETLVSGGAAGDKACWISRNVDDIHVTIVKGTWTCT